MVHPRRFGDDERVIFLPELLAKGVRIDLLEIGLLGLVVCRHGEEEVAGSWGKLVDGQLHERLFMRQVVVERAVDAVVVKDCYASVGFD